MYKVEKKKFNFWKKLEGKKKKKKKKKNCDNDLKESFFLLVF